MSFKHLRLTSLFGSRPSAPLRIAALLAQDAGWAASGMRCTSEKECAAWFWGFIKKSFKVVGGRKCCLQTVLFAKRITRAGKGMHEEG